MSEPTKEQAIAFAREVCASIQEHEFDMRLFKRGSYRYLPTCGTAMCKAGHIVAVRRTRARELMKVEPDEFTDALGEPDFTSLAFRIWEEETGRAYGGSFFDMGQTKAEALKEIQREARK